MRFLREIRVEVQEPAQEKLSYVHDNEMGVEIKLYPLGKEEKDRFPNVVYLQKGDSLDISGPIPAIMRTVLSSDLFCPQTWMLFDRIMPPDS